VGTVACCERDREWSVGEVERSYEVRRDELDEVDEGFCGKVGRVKVGLEGARDVILKQGGGRLV